jgi:hypothetical protein
MGHRDHGDPPDRNHPAGGRAGCWTARLLREFVLPLGAARASHYAAFFAEHGHDDLARIKDQQAQLLGAVFCDAAGSDLAALGDGLERLADLEASFTAALATAVLP